MIQKNKQLPRGLSEEAERVCLLFFLQYKDREVPGERSKNWWIIPNWGFLKVLGIREYMDMLVWKFTEAVKCL